MQVLETKASHHKQTIGKKQKPKKHAYIFKEKTRTHTSKHCDFEKLICGSILILLTHVTENKQINVKSHPNTFM